MKIERGLNVDYFRIMNIKGLDPITVILNSSGKMIVECYGEAWGIYFGGYGNNFNNFIAGVGSSYLID